MTGTTPHATVIVVCWNVADVLGQCLTHLLNQDYENYEILVVDDGSDDNTVEIAQQALVSGILTIVRSPTNRGCAHARNLGLRHAKGEIIAFIDADAFAAATWLSRVVVAFEGDETIGGVASTVFFAANPMVINGAGGTINRQGLAADLSLNESYERAEIASEALYPMGCGMAVRRSAAERVGAFDDRMLNYYDDVDYGIRLWRAGYRVVVAADAWVDHEFRFAGTSPRRSCFGSSIASGSRLSTRRSESSRAGRVSEVVLAMRAPWPRYRLKRSAIEWNLRHLLSVIRSRWQSRRQPGIPARLVDPSWGERFPVGREPLMTPDPEAATNVVDMANSRVERQLLYGWFYAEHEDGLGLRWAGRQAAVLIRLEKPARRLHLHYRLVSSDLGVVGVSVRRVGSPDRLAPVWSGTLSWLDGIWCIENHPLFLSPGEYEVIFNAERAWSNPPADDRSLVFALAKMSFGEDADLPAGGIDIGQRDADRRLVNGWFPLERNERLYYRWASQHAALVLRLVEHAEGISLDYRFPSGPTGGLRVSLFCLQSRRLLWSARVEWHGGDWRSDSFSLKLCPGSYLLSFDSETTWTNPDQRDPTSDAENRSLGFALSSISFNNRPETEGES